MAIVIWEYDIQEEDYDIELLLVWYEILIIETLYEIRQKTKGIVIAIETY